MKRENPDSVKKISFGDGGDSQRISFYDYLVVFVMIIYGGKANSLVESGSLKENIVGFLLPVILGIILVIRWKVKLDQNFYLLIFGFFQRCTTFVRKLKV